MIKLESISKHFDKHVALKDVSLEISDQEFVCFVGESGSGKTTLLKVIAGLDDPHSGSVVINGRKLRGTNFDVSMVFQNSALLPWLTVFDNIIFPFTVTHAQYDLVQINALIADVGLEGFKNSYPRDLSGGQRQRVGIARALAVQRRILLLDEPFSALDIKTATELRRDLLALWKKNNLTVLMVSHLVEEALELADRVVIMKAGEIRSIVRNHLLRPRAVESRDFLKLSDHIKNIIEI